MNKKKLELELAKLEVISNPKAVLEQYDTPAGIAAEILWQAYLKGDIVGKVVADFGCGSGIFGVGAILLGAKLVYFVDIDQDALKICKKNLRLFGFDGKVINMDISTFNRKVDVVFQNPPFGVQVKHADKRFLEKAMELSGIIYSVHKIESEKFIRKFCKSKGFEVLEIKPFNMRLKKTQDFHTKNFYSVKVGCFLIRKL